MQRPAITFVSAARHQLQQVLLLASNLQKGSFLVKHFLFSFHGDAKALKKQGPWPKEKFKDAFKERKRTVDVQSFIRPFDESHRPTRNCPSLLTQLPTALGPQFPSPRVDHSSTGDLNAPGNFDQSTSPSTLEVVQPGSKASSKPEPTVSTISEHRRPRRAESSTSDQRAPSPNNGRPIARFETSNKQIEAGVESKHIISNQAVRRIRDRGAHLLSNSQATQTSDGKTRTRLEPAYIVADQAKSFQIGRSQVTGGRHIQCARTTSEAIAALRNRLQRAITTDSYTYIKVLQMCSKQKDLLAAKQVHDCIIQSGMENNKHVAVTLLHVYIRCGGVSNARRVFDEIEKKTIIAWNAMIAGYARTDDVESAMELFKLMGQDGARPDEVTYLCILKACASTLALTWGKNVHECIRQAGLESDVRVGTALLEMYAKCGCITEARQLFENLPNRDVITWNVMIGGLAQHGCGDEAYQLFLQMRGEGFEPDAFTYASIFKTSASKISLEWVKQVHGHAVKDGLESDFRVCTALVHTYAQSGSINDARQCFDRMEKRDVVTWNVMIGGLAQDGCGHEAYRVFRQMKREGFEPDAITYLSILNAAASAGALEWVKEVHGQACKAGLESDLRVGNALVHMYAQSGSIDDARVVFDRMAKRDEITWNVMIGGLAQHGCGHEAYRLFRQMRREGFKPDAITYSSILNASASAGGLEWAKEVHGHATKAGLESELRVGNALVHMYAQSGSIDDARLVFDRMEKRDEVTWNVMIGGLAQHGCGHEAYRLFRRMRQEGFEPNAITYLSILNASASAGALEWVKEVHGHASKTGLESDLRVCTALVHMYSQSGSIDDARQVFDRMEKRDVFTWNVMIGGLAYHGCGDEALELFREMNAEVVKPNGNSFVAAMSACCHAGLVDDGRRLFSAMMQDHGIKPDIVHCNCMVDLLGRAGCLEEAKIFISDMPIEADVVTWRTLLGACRTHGNLELGEVGAKEVLRLEPDDAAGYVVLSNIYAAAGKWENVSLVRTMMQRRGIRKEPGRSWIEVDNKVHEFVAGDTSHPEAKAIYTELNKLTEMLKAEGYSPDARLVLHDINEDDKELAISFHSEKLAIAYGLIHIPQEEPILVTKNLRVCPDCHAATKVMSKVTGREIIARDANRFHRFKDGVCSCGDYW